MTITTLSLNMIVKNESHVIINTDRKQEHETLMQINI